MAAIITLLLFYGVGIIGIGLPLHQDFRLLTPLNLLLSLALVLWHHLHWDHRTAFFLVLCYVVGFGSELLGVQTGLLFGDYSYGPVLGPKLWGTPVIIGLNWMLLAYCSGVTAASLAPGSHPAFRAFLAAALMVGLDLFIEPVAIRYDFWRWPGGTPPLQNYTGWFLVAFPLQLAFTKLLGLAKNKVAVALFVIQFLFFLSLGLF